MLGLFPHKPRRRCRIMDRAIAPGADGDGMAGIAAKDDQCGVSVRAGRLGVGIVGGIEQAVGLFVEHTGMPFVRWAP